MTEDYRARFVCAERNPVDARLYLDASLLLDLSLSVVTIGIVTYRYLQWVKQCDGQTLILRSKVACHASDLSAIKA